MGFSIEDHEDLNVRFAHLLLLVHTIQLRHLPSIDCIARKFALDICELYRLYRKFNIEKIAVSHLLLLVLIAYDRVCTQNHPIISLYLFLASELTL